MKISKVLVSRTPDEDEYYLANYDTKITKEMRNGPQDAIPYIVIEKRAHAEAPWKLYAEFPQHNIIGVYYYQDE